MASLLRGRSEGLGEDADRVERRVGKGKEPPRVMLLLFGKRLRKVQRDGELAIDFARDASA